MEEVRYEEVTVANAVDDHADPRLYEVVDYDAHGRIVVVIVRVLPTVQCDSMEATTQT
jgi:hypothetical protein